MRLVELLDTLVEVLVGDWRRGEPELSGRLVPLCLWPGQRKTYTGVEDLRVLAISESLSPGGVMLADPKSWADLGESLRLRVQRPAGRHPECTVPRGSLEVGGVGNVCEGKETLVGKLLGWRSRRGAAAEVRRWGVRSEGLTSNHQMAPASRLGSRNMFLDGGT